MLAQRVALLLTVMMAVVACEPETATFDTSSEEAYRSSLASVRTSVPEDLRKEFDDALKLVVVGSLVKDDRSPLAALSAMASVAQNPAAFVKAVTPVIHGKNGLEVITLAQTLRREQRARQLAAVEGEIAAITAELKDAEAAVAGERLVLDRIRIEGARYYWQKADFRNQAVIAFKITNGSDRALAKITMEGVLETPGRAIPWVKDSFSYAIKGGLEPGESQSLALAPNMFGPWSNQDLENRRDLVITVTLAAIEDATGKAVGGGTSRELEKKRTRLDELKAQRAKLASEQS